MNENTKLVIAGNANLSDNDESTIDTSLFTTSPSNKFILNTNSLDIYSKVIHNSEKRLFEIASFYNGIKTGNNKLFLSDTQKDDSFRAAIRGRDFNRYSQITRSTYVLYDKGKLWSNTDESKLTSTPRILVRQTADSIISTLDQSMSGLPLDTVHILYNIQIDERYLLALMNSRLMTWLYRVLTNEEGRAFAEIKIVHLKTLPIVYEESRVAELQRLVNSQVDHYSDIIAGDIDKIIYDIYSLSPEEIITVESGT